MPWEFQPIAPRLGAPLPVSTPTNISTTRRFIPTLRQVAETSVKLYNLDVKWDAPTITENGVSNPSPWVVGYEAEVKSGENQEWNLRTYVKDTFMTFPNLAFSNYFVRVRAVTFNGSTSNWAESFAQGVSGALVFSNRSNSSLFAMDF